MLLGAGLTLAAATTARATNYTWAGAKNAPWATGANWTGGISPATDSSAVIDEEGPSATYTNVSINTSGTVAGLIFGTAVNPALAAWQIVNQTVPSTTFGIGSLSVADNGSPLSNELYFRDTTSDVLNLNITQAVVEGAIYFGFYNAAQVSGNLNSLNVGTLTLDGTNSDNVVTVTALSATFGTINLSGTASTLAIYNSTTGAGGIAVAVLNGVAGSELVGSSTLTNNNTSAVSAVLVINGASGTANFAGTIANGYQGLASLSVTQQGAGTQVFSGSDSYTGSTTITAGTLLLSGSGSISSSSVIKVGSGGTFDVSQVTGGIYAVSAGQTLGGGGTVKSGVLNVTGNLTPGLGAATTGQNLTVSGSLTLSGTTLLTIYGNGTNDSVTVSAGLLSYGGLLTLTLNGGAGIYSLFDLTNGASRAATDFTGVSVNGSALTDSGGTWSGGSYTFADSTGILTVAAVPEPATWTLLGTGTGLALWGFHRKNRRRKLS